MKQVGCLPHENRRGSALVLSLIFIVIFSAMAVGMASLSGSNVQVADNQRKLDNSRGSAESGLEVLRYWISQVEMSGTLSPGLRFNRLAVELQNELAAAGVTNITPVCDGNSIAISNVTLRSSSNQSFAAVFTKVSDDNVRLDVTGHYGPISKTIRTKYVFDTRANNVFDFGVASRGPISLSGNIDLTGFTINVESNAYIENDPLKTGTMTALTILGNSAIAGFVDIVDSMSYVDMQGGSATIGGVTASNGATQPPYTEYGVPPVEFPEMRPDLFYGYATNLLSATADLSGNTTYDNVRIPAGMNPTFTGHATLRGIIYIEAPNTVKFSGGVTTTAIIVTDGSPTDDSGTNKIAFASSIVSYPVSQLPLETQFDGLHNETGTFMMAPGFKATFTGAFESLSGVIAANNVEFSGGAGGNINGSIINYGYKTMVLGGNSDLQFNRSGLVELPAGFVPRIILRYDPSGYSEVTL